MAAPAITTPIIVYVCPNDQCEVNQWQVYQRDPNADYDSTFTAADQKKCPGCQNVGSAVPADQVDTSELGGVA